MSRMHGTNKIKSEIFKSLVTVMLIRQKYVTSKLRKNDHTNRVIINI